MGFGEDLLDDDAVSHAHGDVHSKFLELFFLSHQIETELRTGFEETIEIFFETNKVGINRGRFSHNVQERYRATDRGRKFAR